MSVESAQKFIKQALGDQALRDSLNVAEGWEGRVQALTAAGFDFSPCEAQEAFRNQLSCCKTEDAAEEVQELQMWWDLLQNL